MSASSARRVTTPSLRRALIVALVVLISLANAACVLESEPDRRSPNNPPMTNNTTANNTTANNTTANNTTGETIDEEIQALLARLPEPTLPATTLSYTTTLPAHVDTPALRRFDNTPTDNPITDAGATLGRVLFYDRLLSKNGQVACASCHVADQGFSDARVLSRGFDGGDTRRHSMPLMNLRYYPRQRMFWDERAATLEEQVLMPIQDTVEMGLTLEELVARVEAAPYYAALFEEAFGDSAITSARIGRAMAQFVRSIVSFDSKWDRAVAQEADITGDMPGFSAQENRGKEIFFGQHDPNTRGLCGTCHVQNNPLSVRPGGPGGPPQDNLSIFFMVAPSNNGLLDEDDDGVAEQSANPQDVGAFKSPSLRNIELRPPYMHDGRFATLEEVVEHYNSGVQAHPNLDPALRAGGGPGAAQPIRLNLSTGDKAALVAFLKTLTDRGLATQPRLLSPFPAPPRRP